MDKQSITELVGGRDMLTGAPVDAPVLAAVDLSETSESALIWAFEYAERTGLPLTALHVVHDPAEAPGKYWRGAGHRIGSASDIAETMLLEFLARIQAAHPDMAILARVDRELVCGLPAHSIVNQARRLNASLIVLGSRGQSAVQRLMNGSTAQKVMQLSPVAVTIVKTPGL